MFLIQIYFFVFITISVVIFNRVVIIFVTDDYALLKPLENVGIIIIILKPS
jgi:hypothetical protein